MRVEISEDRTGRTPEGLDFFYNLSNWTASARA